MKLLCSLCTGSKDMVVPQVLCYQNKRIYYYYTLQKNSRSESKILDLCLLIVHLKMGNLLQIFNLEIIKADGKFSNHRQEPRSKNTLENMQ